MPKTTYPVAALILVLGCAAPQGPDHEPRGLQAREGERVALATDLDPALAGIVLDRLEKTEQALEQRVRWLAPPSVRVRVLVIGDDVLYRGVARSHGVTDPATGAFACSAGEVVVRFRPEEWGQGPREGWFLAPRSAPVSEALFRQRLEARYGGALTRTRLEDGCARAFAEQAALQLGEAAEATRRERDDLLSAFIPIFLGSDRVLAKTATASGSAAEEHGSSRSTRSQGAPALGYAVARFLSEADGAKRAPLVAAILAHAAGEPGEGGQGVYDRLDQDEEEFERWLRDATVSALLDALASEPVPAARWEARSALRLVAGMDLDDEAAATPEERAQRIERARAEARKLKSVRLIDEFDSRLLAARHNHSSLEKVLGAAKAELDRRAAGYGHPAIEEGRARLGQAFQERLKELTARREPG